MLIDIDYKPLPLSDFKDVYIEGRPLELWAYQKVINLLEPFFDSGEEDITIFAKLASLDMQPVVEKVFPTHLQNLKNVNIKENGIERPAQIEELYHYGYFTNLCLDILIQLFHLSTVMPDEEKNSEGRLQLLDTQIEAPPSN